MNCNSENNGQINIAGNQFPAPSDLVPQTLVVNKHKHTPTPNDVYIGRGSQWGNIFSHYEGTKAQFLVGSREEAIALHRLRLWSEIKTGVLTLEDLAALHGKTLVCFCAPKRCHGHTLAKAAAWAVEQLAKPGVRLDAPYGVHAYMDSSTEKEV